MIVLFMVLIVMLSSIPITPLKELIRDKIPAVDKVRAYLKETFNIRISFTMLQNILHIPFFGVLAFLWMRFFAKREVRFKKALIYTFLIIPPFSLFSEITQFFLPGRDTSIGDVLMDLGGYVGGVVTYRLTC